MPGRPSAPSSPIDGPAGAGPCSRTTRHSANATDPSASPPTATARPVPGQGASTRKAAIAGPRMKNTSRLIAS
jgi:hypothetical protein